jgi:hypothetical protein
MLKIGSSKLTFGPTHNNTILPCPTSRSLSQADGGGSGSIWQYIKLSEVGDDMEWDHEQEAAERREAARQREAAHKKKQRGRKRGDDGGWLLLAAGGAVATAGVERRLALGPAAAMQLQNLSHGVPAVCAVPADEVASEDDLEKGLERQVAQIMGRERQYVSEEEVGGSGSGECCLLAAGGIVLLDC